MTAPALVVSIPLLLGVLLGAFLHIGTGYAVAALLPAWVTCGWCLRRSARTGVVVSAVAGCVAAGVLLGTEAATAAERPSLMAWFTAAAHDGATHVVGELREDAATTVAGTSITLDVREADGEHVAGGVRISVAGGLAIAAAPAWRAGRLLAIDAQLREPLDYRDPGVPSDRARLARQGVILVGSSKSAALVSIRAKGSAVAEAAASLRAWVRAGTADAVGRWSPPSAGVVTAILIGDRTGLAQDDERRLQEAGTYHVIAISGGNIALLTALLVALGRTARLPARPTALASIGVLAFYGYAAGLAPSVLRATVAGMIYLAARAADHRGAALNAIGVAAAFACVTAPLSVLDPGFVLSFGATFAIIVAVRRLSPSRVARKDRPRSRMKRAVTAVVFAAQALGAATICAEIALAPASAFLFGRVSLAGLLLNFAAIPLMSIIQIAGLVAVFLVPLSSSLAGMAGWIAHVCTLGLLRSAALVDVAPWLVIDVPPPALWVVACWYVGWAAILVTRRHVYRWIALALIIAAALPAWSGLPSARKDLVPPPPPGWTRTVVFDVGQGDATLLWPAGARPLLVDAGGVPGSSFDLGRRVTLPAAWAFGVRRLSALVVTHGDPDHIGGAPAILRALAPLEIWEGVPVPTHEPLQRLHASADRAGIPWIARRTGEALTIGSAAIRVLNPPAPDWERPRVRNDDSIVLDVRIGDVAIVLPGDITQAVEPAVAAHFEPAPLVILKAPHHGSAGSSSQRFIDALNPAAVIFSAGRRNPFGHPAPAVVDRYRTAGVRTFSTADDGAVVIDTDGHTAVVWTVSGRREVLTSPLRRADGSGTKVTKDTKATKQE